MEQPVKPALYRLSPVEAPLSELSPGSYVYAVGDDRLEIHLRQPIQPRHLAALIRQIPQARSVAA